MSCYTRVRALQAESNVKRVLVTKPEVGTKAWGLVEEGKKQAKKVLDLPNNVASMCMYIVFHGSFYQGRRKTQRNDRCHKW